MKKIWTISAIAAAVMMTGCGGSSNDNNDDTPEVSTLPAGLTFIMFDDSTSDQYLYNTETKTSADMNIETEKYDMTGENGKLVVWTHHMEENGEETEEQKVVMLNDVEYNILDDDNNVTYDNIHYLGHFHDDGFAAHSANEFDPAIETNATILAKKLVALDSLSAHLLEQEVIREELEEALEDVSATGELCNFIVLGGHEEHGDEGAEEEEEHGAPHIALTTDGYVYVFEEASGHVLEQTGVHFLLDGVQNCKENESNIVKIEETGVAIFSAESQKLYLVDKHAEDGSATYGTDFHVHTTVEIAEIMPAGFTPTSVVAVGEGDHDH